MKNTFQRLLICVVVATLASNFASLNAQEIEQEIQESSGERTEMTVIAGDGIGAPMIFSTTETLGGDGPAARVMMAGPGNGGSFSFMGTGNGDFVMPAPDPFSMLGNPSVQKDLELVGDQRDKVMDMQKKFTQAIQEKIGDLSKGGIGPERFEGIGEVIKQMREDQRAELESMLLPHQIERLKQVALQTHMNQAGTANALASDKVAEVLGISDEQKERLKDRQKELKEKLAKDIEALREKAKNDLLMELDAGQRDKLKKMMGEKYKPNTQDWAEQFQQRRSMRTPRGGGGDN